MAGNHPFLQAPNYSGTLPANSMHIMSFTMQSCGRVGVHASCITWGT